MARSDAARRWRSVWLGATLFFGSVPAAAAQHRPNVIVVIADDLGLGDLAPYGQDRIRTPALARLAERGTTFTVAYAAAPVCAPSRCAILTGLHAGHCSVRRNIQPNLGLSPSDPNLADVLRAVGYRTALVGKWGLGGEAGPGVTFATWSAPAHLGFDTSIALLDDEAAISPFPTGLWRDGVWTLLPENADGARGRWGPELVSDDAVATLDRLLAEESPFLLVVGSTLPHREYFVPELGPEASDWPEVERIYAAMVEALDADVGRLVARLEETGALDRTLFLVTSDHGPNEVDGHTTAFFDSTAGLRGRKRDLYEGGVRVPLLVAGPGVPAGAHIDVPVSLVDLVPTLAALGGAPAPDALDGTSLAPLLAGETLAPRPLFFGAAEGGGGSEPPTRYALRDGDLVLVEREDGGSELYDVAVDPAQARDLAAGRPADVERLRALRLAESTGSLLRGDPVLALDGLEPPAARTTALVLDLAPEGVGPFPSRVRTPSLRAISVDSVPDGGGVLLPRDPSGHLVVGAHPALSFGEESFSVEAELSLRSLAASVERSERRWLALVKPTGMPDGAIDWGVLVQAADAGLPSGSPSPGALALVFGRGRLREDDVWVVRSQLAIEDQGPHAVAVRFDAAARRVTFSLDGALDEIVLPEDLGHVRSDGPLVIGAHHDAHGIFDEGLDGVLSSFRLARGAGAITPPEARTIELRIGTLPLGSAPLVRHLRVRSAARPPSRAMALEVREAGGDPRVTFSLDRELVLGSTDEGATLTVTVTPSYAGGLDARLSLEGTVLRLGYDAVGSPVAVRVYGDVAAPTPTFSIGVIEAGALLTALGLVVVAVRRRRG